MGGPTIEQIYAYTVRGGAEKDGADYQDVGAGLWIDGRIRTPIVRFREYPQSLGLNVFGTLMVEIETSDHTVGFAVTTGVSRAPESRSSTLPVSPRAVRHRHREELGVDVVRGALVPTRTEA